MGMLGHYYSQLGGIGGSIDLANGTAMLLTA